jgi:hypothetical protein
MSPHAATNTAATVVALRRREVTLRFSSFE